MLPEPYADRAEAGRRLAAAVQQLLGDDPAVVLALPRGGVTVAAEVARVLHAPLDVLVVRKIGVPGHRELAMGALAGGTVVRNAEVISALGIDEPTFARVVEEETAVARARERAYRGVRPAVDLAGRTAVVVDDGLATGATARAAVQALRHREHDRPSRVVLAVPVAPPDTLHRLGSLVDATVCLLTPEPFYAVGEWYRHFDQVSDDQVTTLLAGDGTVHGDA
jgi:predicted phosphoribosyltransferase